LLGQLLADDRFVVVVVVVIAAFAISLRDRRPEWVAFGASLSGAACVAWAGMCSKWREEEKSNCYEMAKWGEIK